MLAEAEGGWRQGGIEPEALLLGISRHGAVPHGVADDGAGPGAALGHKATAAEGVVHLDEKVIHAVGLVQDTAAADFIRGSGEVHVRIS